MVQDRAIVTMEDLLLSKSYMIYRSAQFSVTLKTPNHFKVTPIFDTEYLSNGTRWLRIWDE